MWGEMHPGRGRAMRFSPLAGALAIALSPCLAKAADKADIDDAISRGLAGLQKLQNPDGSWSYAATQARAGATALAGLTMLECGVAKDDPRILGAAQFLRKESITLRHTYSTSVAIIFFDRLGDPADVPLIEALTARLITGQNIQNGAWSYWCPEPFPAEQQRLNDLISRRRDSDTDRTDPAKTPSPTSEFRQRMLLLNRQAPNLGPAVLARADNSNTQFAVLALWVARRHNLPVDQALRGAAAHFRTTQNADGGWSYDFNLPSETRSTMTCSGILGLAVGWGVRNDKAEKKGQEVSDLSRDKQLQFALRTLSTFIGAPLERQIPVAPAGAGGVPPGGLGVDGGRNFRRGPPPGGPAGSATAGGKAFYFLWSLERVAVILNLSTVNKKDWYGWGSDVLMMTQQPNGLWQGEYAEGGVDTCFALLFLKKANFANDLSKLTGHVDDGQVQLKAGGVGGGALTGPKGENSKKVPDDGAPEWPVTPARPILPTKERPSTLGDTPGAKLAEKLLAMSGDQQATEIERLRDKKGADNTEALAIAIPYLSSGDVHVKAREALAERLSRMKAETLTGYLQDDTPEIRRAAALACAMQENKQYMPRLIALLSDPQPIVSRAAYAALKSLSGEDFGPASNADDAAVKRATADWQEWWKKHSQ
jgi:HEAT repeats